jgi:hypothetical protein
MSILFVLLIFLLVMSISYFRSRGEVAAEQPEVWAGPPVPRLQREYGFSTPVRILLPSRTYLGAEGGWRECAGGRRQLRDQPDRQD